MTNLMSNSLQVHVCLKLNPYWIPTAPLIEDVFFYSIVTSHDSYVGFTYVK